MADHSYAATTVHSAVLSLSPGYNTHVPCSVAACIAAYRGTQGAVFTRSECPGHRDSA